MPYHTGMLLTDGEMRELYALFEAYFNKSAPYRETGEAARRLLILLDRAEHRVYRKARRELRRLRLRSRYD
jgi:hypothetical protein